VSSMALNITEATAVNRLADWLLYRNRGSEEQARDALALLADKAYKPLMAGVTGDQVRRRWDKGIAAEVQR
jgi:hypothetical protein